MKKWATRKPPPHEALFTPRKQQAAPFPFVLDALAELDPYTRPMFGCTAVYVEEKIMLILRDKPAPAEANGVWVATTREHHESLRAELPSLRSISVLGPGVTGWQMLPPDEPGFEEEVMRAVALILAGDARIGKVPTAKRPRGPKTKAKAPKAKAPKAKAPKVKVSAKKAAKAPAKKVAKAKKPGR